MFTFLGLHLDRYLTYCSMTIITQFTRNNLKGFCVLRNLFNYRPNIRPKFNNRIDDDVLGSYLPTPLMDFLCGENVQITNCESVQTSKNPVLNKLETKIHVGQLSKTY